MTGSSSRALLAAHFPQLPHEFQDAFRNHVETMARFDNRFPDRTVYLTRIIHEALVSCMAAS